jgi:hypothetical protein
MLQVPMPELNRCTKRACFCVRTDSKIKSQVKPQIATGRESQEDSVKKLFLSMVVWALLVMLGFAQAPPPPTASPTSPTASPSSPTASTPGPDPTAPTIVTPPSSTVSTPADAVPAPTVSPSSAPVSAPEDAVAPTVRSAQLHRPRALPLAR